jgi:hypothetical protein
MIGLAQSEGDPLAKILAPGFLDKVSKIRDAVAQAFEDKTNRAAEAKLATGTQNTAARSMKLWGRKAGAECSRHWMAMALRRTAQHGSRCLLPRPPAPV